MSVVARGTSLLDTDVKFYPTLSNIFAETCIDISIYWDSRMLALSYENNGISQRISYKNEYLIYRFHTT